MRRYSVQPRYQIFVKGYGFLSNMDDFCLYGYGKDMGKNIGKNLNIVKNVLIMLNNLPQMLIKLLQKAIQKTGNR